MKMWNTANMTHYQRVKSRAARTMIIMGVACLFGTIAALLFTGIEIVLFLGAASLGFLLVGYQQQIDALATENDHSCRRE